MARTRENNGFMALRIEGGILPPEFLRTIATLEAPRQKGTDYGLSKSLELRDELARYWRIANDLYSRYRERRDRKDLDISQIGVNEWLVPLLQSTLGYEDLMSIESVTLSDRVFKLTHSACGEAVPLLLTTRDFSLDKSDPHFGYEGRRQTPHGLMQEYLNTEDDCLWGIVSNGSNLRILRDNPSLTRPSCIEADLDLMFDEELYSNFAVLWLTAHSSRLAPTNNSPSSCAIETWRTKAHETGERILENLRHGVTEALRQIGNGFLQHKDNDGLRTSLTNGTLSTESYFQQLLMLIYRMLFLFTVEERNLLHTPEATETQREVFADGYSISHLRERALRRRHYDHHKDLWQCLQITFSALAQGTQALGLPALGGLFHLGQCPNLDNATIANSYLLEAIRNLGFFRSDKVLARVNYRDMGTEELGSVYESLLELQPFVDINSTPWTFSFVGNGNQKKTKGKGSKRKLTGSYYTPPTLVNELIKSALEPVLKQTVLDNLEDPKAAILDLKVLDPACGSGHFLLAAAHRIAAEITRIESDTDTPDESARQHALREVVRHCIYGVDRNSLAVELCKTALWIETVEPGKPLTFLDSHIQHGDSLIGILEPEIMMNGIPNDAYKVLAGDDKTVCANLRKRNRQADRSVQRRLFEEENLEEPAVATPDLNNMPEETLDDIERKSATWKIFLLDETLAQKELRANLFVGAYFAEKTHATIDTVPITEDINRVGVRMSSRPGVEDTVNRLADQYNFFHWHLAFAEIIQRGGFDVVLGNPPWEVSQLSEEEYFASRAPSIADLPGAKRKAAIVELEKLNPPLWKQYQLDKRGYNASNMFCNSSGRYPLTTYGKLNSYSLFTETFLCLINPQGLAGLIVPTGIATDDSRKTFFNEITTKRRLVSLYDFENRERIFPDVHRSYKFCLLTLSGTKYPCPQAEFAFFLHRTEHIRNPERLIVLSAEDFTLFNPNTRTSPTFRTLRDMEIARKMYRRAGVLLKEAREDQPEINPWGVKFSTMFNMTTNSDLFRDRKYLESEGWKLVGNIFVRGEERYLPLYEAKLFHQYDHRFASFEDVSDKDIKNGNPKTLTSKEKLDFKKASIPRYWVPEVEVLKKLDKCKTISQAQLTRQDKTRQDKTRQDKTRQDKDCLFSPNWFATRFQKNHPSDRRTDRSSRNDTCFRSERLRNNNHPWLIVFRDIARSTDQRTSIFTVIRGTAMSNKAPLLLVDYVGWLQAFRSITRATDERTMIADTMPLSGIGNSAPVMDYDKARAIASTLVLANMNSIPLDWTARFSVGGINMNFFIVKQLPVLPPEAYLEEACPGLTYAELVVPRVLELTYTDNDLDSFAKDLGYEGPPFPWNVHRRHCLKCELDAIFAHMYKLDRSELEWILDAPYPSSSFPTLKNDEIKEFGDYRTQHYVLRAYDQLKNGEILNLEGKFTQKGNHTD